MQEKRQERTLLTRETSGRTLLARETSGKTLIAREISEKGSTVVVRETSTAFMHVNKTIK